MGEYTVGLEGCGHGLARMWHFGQYGQVDSDSDPIVLFLYNTIFSVGSSEAQHFASVQVFR